MAGVIWHTASQDKDFWLPVVLAILVSTIVLFAANVPVQADWEPAEGPLATRWAKEVSPDNAHPEYPRPQMVRQQWLNLNGLWDYAIRPRAADRPETWDGKILVPFAAESALSGVKKPVGSANRLWYHRIVSVPDDCQGKRILLHFGAVDWETAVWVNDQPVGTHRGGYDPFTFDISTALSESGEQKIVVSVWDPTDEGSQARGKQVREPRGIWYTAVTGIWRTVWLEAVPHASIAGLRQVPDIDSGTLALSVRTSGAQQSDVVRAVAADGQDQVAKAEGQVGTTLVLKINQPNLWSPDQPFLYDLEVSLVRNKKIVDSVSSYFGMRKISLGPGQHGHTRLLLNDQPLFQIGPLDQGWWPDGLYTAPTDDALRYDVEVTKKLGFNMLRKHVKVEPARFYYHCDKLGVLVWQDMPSGFPEGSLRVGPGDAEDVVRDAESARQFESEFKAVIDWLYNHPSIVMWVPFNEGWGQYDTERIARWTKQYDPTRPVNPTSGWTDRAVGDVFDAHMYPGPGMEFVGKERASVLGEFGGLGLPVQGHLWWDKRNWGYRTYTNRTELRDNYQRLIHNLCPMLDLGLAAAVYTQTTDVEGEVNGLMTYDREVIKYDPAEMQRLHAPLYQPPGRAQVLLNDSEHKPHCWRYTFREPGEGWRSSSFDDSGWQEGSAPFGSGETPFFVHRTDWAEEGIWLRRSFTVSGQPVRLSLRVYSEVEAATVHINDRPVAELEGRAKRHYLHINISEHVDALKQGKNVLSVRAKQSKQRRGIDVGLIGHL